MRNVNYTRQKVADFSIQRNVKLPFSKGTVAWTLFYTFQFWVSFRDFADSLQLGVPRNRYLSHSVFNFRVP